MYLAERMSRLGTESAFEVLAKAKALEAQGKDIIHLEIGQPDFKTPKHICEAAYKAMLEGHTGYSPSAGVLPFRQAAAKYIAESRKVEVDPDEVVVTPGAKPIIFFVILACIDPGDEVIYPNPGFPVYESVIEFVGGRAVPVPLREEADFRFDMDDLKKAISDKTKLIIINSPQNPTGGVLQKSDLEEIAKIAIERDILIMTDEVYCQILYEGSHDSIISIPQMKERTVLIDGHSKTYSMTGWRLGYGVMPKPLSEQVAKLMINSNSCTATFTQMAGIAALEGPQDSVRRMVEEFRIRRDTVVDGLNKIPNISCKKPLGSFYAFPNVMQVGVDCRVLADHLLNNAGVAVLPGTAFGKQGEGYIRISYANSLENLKRALERIKEAIAKI